jgi:hypothetical protein
MTCFAMTSQQTRLRPRANVHMEEGRLFPTSYASRHWLRCSRAQVSCLLLTSLIPVALYGLNLALCGIAFSLLRAELQRQYKDDATMSEHHARTQRKTIFSLFLYLTSVGTAWISVYISEAIFVLIAVIYFLPEKLSDGDE